jgi:glycosyltransferase involved in cell wall biosynthesis
LISLDNQVAIMIPVYNGEKTLPLALASLKAQTYLYWKAYIVNDGSTDGTKAYLDSLTDERFVIIHLNENKGRPYARQVALDAAEGKYLAFLDADDFYHPEKLGRQVDVLNINPSIHLTSSGNASYDSNYNLLTYRGVGVGSIHDFKIGKENPCTLRTSMVILKDAKIVRFNLKLKFAQDVDFIERYLNGKNYNVTEEIGYYYSEFVSVSGKKILKTRWYGLLSQFSSFKYNPFGVSKNIGILLIKWFLTFSLLPFVGVDFLLKNRGKNVDKVMMAEFEAVLNKLKKTSV